MLLMLHTVPGGTTKSSALNTLSHVPVSNDAPAWRRSTSPFVQ
jgi:hypothetical protein